MQRTRTWRTRVWVALGLVLCLALMLETRAPSAQERQPLPSTVAKNFEVVGHTLVGERPVFKLAIQTVNGRWYLYGGSAYHRGWSILDVTDPSSPKVVKFVPGPDNTSTVQMDWAEGRMITPLSAIIPNRGGNDFTKPNEGGFYIWDTTDPVNPKKLGHWKANGTHRNYYDGKRYVHAAASLPGFQGNIYVIVDISNPANPVEVSRWWYPGQQITGGEKSTEVEGRGAGHHGPAMPVGNLVYLAYGSAGVIVLDISDISRPKMVGQFKTTPPFTGGIPTHTVLPLADRKIAIVNSEAIQESCDEGPLLAGILDISDPTKMSMLSYLPHPVPPPGVPFRDFCDKGGRFGPHNVPQHLHAKAAQKQGDILFQTWFNAGLRAFDIADPRQPKEVGYFVPEPTKRYGPLPFNRLVTNFEDVLVDARGNIYCSDRNSGIWVVRYTGPKAQQITDSSH